MGAVGTALAEREATAEEVGLGAIRRKLEASVGEIEKALPGHIDASHFVRTIITALTKSPKLAECTRDSVMLGVMEAARLGLEIADVRGQAYLIPRWDSKDKCNKASFQLGYRGLIDLAARANIIVTAKEVRQHDHFVWTEGTHADLDHRPTLGRRGEVVGYYAVASLADGRKAFEVMSIDEVEEHRDKFASGRSKEQPRYGAWVKVGNEYIYGPWFEHFDAMARKTLIGKVLNYLPQSIELRRAAAIDAEAYEQPAALPVPSSAPALPAAPPAPTDVDTETGEIPERTTSPQADDPSVVDTTAADDAKAPTPWQSICSWASDRGVTKEADVYVMCSQILDREISSARDVKPKDLLTIRNALDALGDGIEFVLQGVEGVPPVRSEPAVDGAVRTSPSGTPSASTVRARLGLPDDAEAWDKPQWESYGAAFSVTTAKLITHARKLDQAKGSDSLPTLGDVAGRGIAVELAAWVESQAKT